MGNIPSFSERIERKKKKNSIVGAFQSIVFDLTKLFEMSEVTHRPGLFLIVICGEQLTWKMDYCFVLYLVDRFCQKANWQLLFSK